MPPTKQAPGPRPKRPRKSSLPIPNPNAADVTEAKTTAGLVSEAAVSGQSLNTPTDRDSGIVERDRVIGDRDLVVSTGTGVERVGEGDGTLARTGNVEDGNADGEEGGKRKVKKVRKVVRVVKRLVKKRVPKVVRKGGVGSNSNDDVSEGLEGRGFGGELWSSGGDGVREVGKLESLVSERVEFGDCDVGVEGAMEGGEKNDGLVGVPEEVGNWGMVDVSEGGQGSTLAGVTGGAGKEENGMVKKPDSVTKLPLQEFISDPATDRPVDTGTGEDNMVEKLNSIAKLPVEEFVSNSATDILAKAVGSPEMLEKTVNNAAIQLPVEKLDGAAVAGLLVEAVYPDSNTNMQVEIVDGDNVTENPVQVMYDESVTGMPEDTINGNWVAEVKEVDVDSVGCRTDESKAEVVRTSGEKGTGQEEVEKGHDGEAAAGGMFVSGELEALERQKKRKTEIFIGGLSKDAKEEDVKKVFGEVGEVVEVRLAINGKTGKGKGFAFVKYASAADAKKALEKLKEVEICGKKCSAAPVAGNDTIFLGNIDKKWKNEDVTKLLQEMGIEKIDKVTVMFDPNNVDRNRGFAFVELETNKDAQIAFRKLQKDTTGKLQNVKIAWAEPLSEPDEEELLKVKSIYAEYLPPSWDEDKVRRHFKKFGQIESVVLARNLHSSKRKDFAFINFKTREEALACIEAFNNRVFTDEGLEVNVKVSLAKPIPKDKLSKKVSKSTSKENSKQNPTATKRPVKSVQPRNKGMAAAYINNERTGNRMSSSETTTELERLLAERALLKQTRARMELMHADFSSALPERKRSFSMLGHDMYQSDPRHYNRMRVESSFPIGSLSHHEVPPSIGVPSFPYYNRPRVGYASDYEYADYTNPVKRDELPYPGNGNLHYRY